ncbi:ATP-dependent DNA helicase RecG [Candidatus Nomurabacteria bacterium]|nr:ATP-dependent DNA helicase RecG [Candidatus Nomurabacteria bacterium]
MYLHTKVTQLKGVGKTLESRLGILGIQTVQDLLFHFPFRYEDFSKTQKIALIGDADMVNIRATIELIQNRRSPRARKMMTEALVSDDTGQIRVIWFGQPFIVKNLKVGDEVNLSGKVKLDRFGLQMVGPNYEKVSGSTIHTARIIPVYPTTAGLTQKHITSLMVQAIRAVEHVREWLPDDLQKRVQVIALQEALHKIHFPQDKIDIDECHRRLKFDELFVLQLRAEMIRQSLKASSAPKISFHEDHIRDFVQDLPFTLTKDQKVSAWEIFQDLQKQHPMNRLLEGDVGSGKTVVAAMTAYNAVLDGFQVSVMAPTEILATQHFESFVHMLGRYDVTIGLLTSNQLNLHGSRVQIEGTSKKKKRESFLNLLQEGKIDVVLGTHALLTDDVQFGNLGYAIVDEQHRFGVQQRKNLKDVSGNTLTMPHFLSMTATPIPRSFALTLYGDLDLSIIGTKPKGRKEIITRVVDAARRQDAYGFIRTQVKEGRQVFVICPMIEDQKGNAGEKKTVMQEYAKLSEKVFPDLRVAYLHGKLKAIDKQATMDAFSSGEIDVLVSTSVIEVGVNVPNATIMMIEGAERFGLAQLHQFRGRVGRADHQSYCFVFTESNSQKVVERLKYFEGNSSGFDLAEYDLQTRGPGEVYGTSQSGMMQFKLATMRDVDLIKLAREAARDIDFEKYPQLKEQVKKWEQNVHLE